MRNKPKFKECPMNSSETRLKMTLNLVAILTFERYEKATLWAQCQH